MGRSGGGRSSGGHSGGGFGGGHSSGGFSGGGRTSSHFSGRSFRESPRDYPHHHRPPRPFFGLHHHYYHEPGYVYRSSYNSSWISSVIAFLIILMFLIVPMISSNSTITIKNTKQRVALNAAVSKTDWYEDNIGWITSKNELISGLETFYNKTGVQPYILLVPYSSTYWNGNDINATKADEYLEKVYEEKFDDEGHFIFAYFQCKNDSKSEMDGEFRYLSGYSADTIMDSEAINILWGYFEKNYYNTSLSIEKMISNTFSETAKLIMSKPTNGWDFAKVLLVAIVIILIVITIYKMTKNKQKREKEKEEFTEKILEKPLETFGTDTSELEKKYEDK